MSRHRQVTYITIDLRGSESDEFHKTFLSSGLANKLLASQSGASSEQLVTCFITKCETSPCRSFLCDSLRARRASEESWLIPHCLKCGAPSNSTL